MDINEILLALFDFVPCVLCFISMLMLQKCLYHQMSKYSFAMLAAGTIMVLFAGISKATWKLLYFTNIVDFKVLNDLMFPVQAFGFTFAFIGLIIMFIDFKREDKNEVKTKSLAILAPVAYTSNLLFVPFQVIGTFGIFGIVSAIAFKKKKAWIGIIMIIACFCYLGMAGLSSAIGKIDKVADVAKYMTLNWAAEGVNTLGQVLFLVSMIELKKLDISNLKELFKKGA